MSDTQDRRVRKTKQLLRSGLTQLLKEKPINTISVKELAQLVDINRGTFYLHYTDVYQLLDDIEKELLAQLMAVFSKYTTAQLSAQPLPLITDIFHFLQQNAHITTVLLGSNGNISFVERIRDIVWSNCFNVLIGAMPKAGTTPVYYEYFYSFAVDGAIGMFKRWLSTNMEESPSEMANIMYKILIDGVKNLE